MLRVDQLRLLPGEDVSVLADRAAKVLQVPVKELQSVCLFRRSIDAREGVCFICSVLVSVKNEEKVLRRCRSKHVSKAEKQHYAPPAPISAPEVPPIIVGAGPAGLFAALLLAEAGAKPILLERGQAVEQRQKDVQQFWATGVLDTRSNVQFGEGGAGAFSDGKLNTGTKDPRHRYILHIVLKNLRAHLLRCGADIRFGHQLTDLTLDGGALRSVTVKAGEESYVLPCHSLLLAPGHSARDTFEMLHSRGIPMEPKAFAVGVRIEHRQKDIDAAQYKEYAGHPALPASSYKLACHLPNGRGVFSAAHGRIRDPPLRSLTNAKRTRPLGLVLFAC